MYEFEYHRALSITDASAKLEEQPEAKLLAGGMSLLPMMKLRLVQASDIIDLCDLHELRGIESKSNELIIGAMTTHATVASSDAVRHAIPAVAELAGGIGDPHCRNRGTIGGSLAHSDPAACYPSAVLGLAAVVVTNRRSIPADEFFRGPFETALESGEIVVAVKFPIPDHAAYIKFIQPASRFSIVGLFVSFTNGRARVAVTGAGSNIFRLRALEEALSPHFAPEAIEDVNISSDGFTSDMHARADYRAHLAKVLTKRAILACEERNRTGAAMSIHFDGVA